MAEYVGGVRCRYAETLDEFRYEPTEIGVALGILENLARGRYGSFERDFVGLLSSDNSL